MSPFPKIEPFDQGFLDVGHGHSIYWETSGKPDGVPALVLHGGPGSGSSPGLRSIWDPERYLIVQMDQRNCGRSTPSAADPAVPLTHNTTHDLVADIERLREHLAVDRWVLWGGSWGTTLALVYAQKYPERVRALLLVYLMLNRPGDLRWLYHDMGRYFPEEWQEFCSGVGQGAEENLIAAYHRLLNESGDEVVQREAARRWCAWEDTVSSLDPGWRPSPRLTDPDYCLTFARIETHYFSNDIWLTENQVLQDAHRLAGIPGVIIHGREDRANPYDMAWLLAESWPDGELVTLPGGHTTGKPSSDAMLAAAARFALLP